MARSRPSRIRLNSPLQVLMQKTISSPTQFVIIGENIHTTRVVRRNGRRATTLPGGVEAVEYRDRAGNVSHLTVPEHFTRTQPYEQGNLKHFMIAVWKGLHGDADEAAQGTAYVQREVYRQIAAGAHYLDLNVDEASYRLEEQIASMEWLIRNTQSVSSAPPSVDSSNPDIIAAGLEAYDGSAGRPMLNSVALERIDTLDLAVRHNARVILTAASVDGMPDGAAERVENIGAIVEKALSAGIAMSDIFVDGLVFPISVSGEYGMHYLEAVQEVRNRFGNEIHLTGGISNVSFGLPKRRLINDAFLYLAIQHGLDSGIINPIETKLQRIMNLDLDSEPVKITMQLLRGEDDFCMNYLDAYRSGKLG